MRLALVLAAICALALWGALDSRHSVPLRPIPRPQGPKIAVQDQPGPTTASRDSSAHQNATGTPLPQKAQESSPSTQTDTNCFEEEKPNECANRRLQEQVARFTFWLVIVGVIQSVMVGLTVAIYFVMRNDSVTFNSAAVFLNGFVQIPMRTPHGTLVGWSIGPVWENSGNTRTRRMMNQVNWCTLSGKLPEGFDFPDYDGTPPARFFLGPRQRLGGERQNVGVEYMAAAKLGQLTLYIWGWTEYRDLFSLRKLHRTEFCYRVNVLGDPHSADCLVDYDVVGGFNGADESCYRKPGEQARRVPVGQPAWPPPA